MSTPVPQLRRTAIIATIGPATDSPEMLDRLILAGMDVARLNMSHAKHDATRAIVAHLREASVRLDRRVAILMDLQGPAIRTGDLPVDLHLEPGQTIALTVRGEVSEEHASVDVNYDHLVDDLSVGDTVLVDNGNIHLKVLSKQQNQLVCEVLTDGVLGSRRHINLPGIRVNLPALTEKDLLDIALGIELEVDYFAMSFVREANDITRLRGILDYHRAPQKIVAKLEDQQGIRNLDGIIEEADAIMVARGDLGIEVSYEELPIVQRRVVKHCLQLGRPVIVATHMLESMIENPSPTRAEITDVANAVYEQADAIMLSGETSVGKYPIKCIEVMDRVARRTERSGGAGYGDNSEMKTNRDKIARSACTLAENVQAAALLVFTRQGRTAQAAARFRPLKTPIFAFANNQKLVNQLSLLWGTDSFFMQFNDQDPGENVQLATAFLLQRGLLAPGDTVIVMTEVKSRGKMLNTIQLEQV